MNKTWKALASITVAAALVIAPLAVSGAVADDTPPDQTAAAVPAEAVAPEPAPAEPTAVDAAVTAVVDTVVDAVTAPVQQAAVSSPYPSYPPAPSPSPSDTPELIVITPTLEWTDPSCYAAGWATFGPEEGVEWGAVLNDDDSTTYYASPAEGYTFPPDAQTQWTVPNLAQLPADSYECVGQPIEVTPTLEWTPPTCDEAGWVTLGDDEGVAWGLVDGENGSNVYTASPTEGYVFPEGVQTQWTVPNLDQLDPNDPECLQVYPVPAQFSADPAGPTCDTAGSFDTGFLGEPYYTEDGYAEYDFENVYVGVDRTVPGEVTLILWAKDGFQLTDLSDAWWTTEDGSYAERTIVLDPATGVFQSDNPEAPCFLAVITLGTPTIEDPCGTLNDQAFLPEDTASVTYAWASDDPEIFEITATVIDGSTVDPLGDWVDNEDGTFTYAFTPPFTNVDCPLIPGGIASQCVSSVPYLAYAVTLPDGFETDDPTPLTITFVNPSGDDYSVSDLPLSGQALWPGASVNPANWPGWVLNADGTYSETTGNFAWTRNPAGVEVIFAVNPTFTTTVTYPAESALCANPPDPGTLAATGGLNMGPWGIAGLAFLTAGLALVYTRRFARR